MLCEIEGCSKPILARGRCPKHYQELPRTRRVTDGPFLNYWRLQKRLLNVPVTFDKALLVTTYLFGSRKSETLELKKKDFFLEYADGVPFTVCNSPVKKNRKEKRKLFPINQLTEQKYLAIIKTHLEKRDPEAFLFDSQYRPGLPIDRSTHYRITTKWLGPDFNPHWLRKLRATHLLNGVQYQTKAEWMIPPIPPQVIRRLMGWTDLRPLRAYERFMVTDTARSMLPKNF